MARSDNMINYWLRDAHAMEEQAVTMLNAQLLRLENYPELRARINDHIDETKKHAELIQGCLERRGAGTSTIKDTTGKLMAMAQTLGGIWVGDEVVKGALANYTFEQMEIASYRILIAATDYVGDLATKNICEEILREEEAMAGWLADHFAVTTQQFLQRDQVESEEAKR
ncbi:hypothetical protein ATN84_05320 [Paramesorhizobium deserti]|uniref:Uncharacterized protein n=1 Tax=Paramesorhizobium deserti TaxID=1494590 RepID=A0A135I288_9HYPH|nr:DUF892 family protein [Paramesorhizobium deserti]KXF79569.1 hypothetical protein ATN84_05320 [Paramesorhizobium deserti]